jgi:GLPGLI family protein
MDKRYYNITKNDEQPFFFDGLEDMDVMLVDDTKQIAGFNCKKAIVSFPDSLKSPYEVFYTDEINIKNPNKANPYKDINGVLMQFIIRIDKMQLLLTASKYDSTSISDEAFKVPENYKRISKDKLKLLFAKLME